MNESKCLVCCCVQPLLSARVIDLVTKLQRVRDVCYIDLTGEDTRDAVFEPPTYSPNSPCELSPNQFIEFPIIYPQSDNDWDAYNAHHARSYYGSERDDSDAPKSDTDDECNDQTPPPSPRASKKRKAGDDDRGSTKRASPERRENEEVEEEEAESVDGNNYCVGCGQVLGRHNPQQFCFKTYCPYADDYNSENDDDDGDDSNSGDLTL